MIGVYDFMFSYIRFDSPDSYRDRSLSYKGAAIGQQLRANHIIEVDHHPDRGISLVAIVTLA